jgi:ribosome maturation factor RimP
LEGTTSPLFCLALFRKMDLAAEIRRLAESKLSKEGLFVVDVVISNRQGPAKVMVFLDGDHGVSIDDCADLSRELGKELDENGWIENNYTLEVSTAGIDQPLKMVRQYKKNIGRKVKVKLKEKTIEGRLSEVNDDKILLIEEIGSGKKKEERIHEIAFAEIEKTLVMVSFK